jgi:2-polyprenyl-3-methyl-5-hydroxy-6-metoxy-1,4-benzoquinol methylase
MKFQTELKYTCRENKMAFVYDKYKDIFKKSVLDVGADECHLMKYLPKDVAYKGIGLGSDNPNLIAVNLEEKSIPLEDNSYNTVMCLDVLEHLENIHDVIDELLRISEKYVLISLPNPYQDIMSYLKNGKYMGRDKDMKFYGLTNEREADRHKWFYSPTDAKKLIEYKADKAGYNVIDFQANNSAIFGRGLKGKIKMKLFKKLFHPSVNIQDFELGTMWWVLEKK